MIDEQQRFGVVACGRRWGKTLLGINRIVPWAAWGYPALWCVPSFRADDTEGKLVQAVRPMLRRHDAQKHQIRLSTGGRIDVHSLEDEDSTDAIRGKAYAVCVVDEAAKVRRLAYAWEQVIRPTLTDFRGIAWFLSTPKSLNYFHRLFVRGQDRDEPDWKAWRFPTIDNPWIPAGEVETARRDLPERVFAQEYEAQFLETEGAVFRRVLEAVRPPAPEWQPGPPWVNGETRTPPMYVVGVDWARLSDFTVYCVLDVVTKTVVAVDRFHQVDYAVQLGRLEALCERFHPVRIIAERNAMGDPLVEQLRRLGLPVWPFHTTAASKAAAIEALALAFERGDITIPEDRVLIGELLAYNAERLPSGLLRYEAPSGGHDDCVMALALAWQSAVRPALDAEAARSLYGW